jgi:hypothetical protein
MVLTKDELIQALQHEVRIILHLASKADPARLHYRPTPKQRSTLELLQYLTILGPIHVRGVLRASFDMDAWRTDWQTSEGVAKGSDLEKVKESLAALPAFFAESLGACSDADLRAEYSMFGRKVTRGSWLVSLVLCHYTAYRMQLFLYLKSSGREELDTVNLWVGVDKSS